MPEKSRYLMAAGCTYDHFEKIKKSDIVFFVNLDGYIGNSATLELGVAVANSKHIVALKPGILLHNGGRNTGGTARPHDERAELAPPRVDVGELGRLWVVGHIRGRPAHYYIPEHAERVG